MRPAEGDESGANHDAEDPEQRAGRNLRRDRSGSRARDLRWCRLDYCSCGSHTAPVYCLVRTVAVTESPGRSFLVSSAVVECDLDRNSLNNLGVVTGGIVWRQQRKLRSARRSDFDYFAVYDLPGILVDPDLRRIAYPDIRELRFFVVCLHPARAIDKGNDFGARRDQLPWPDLPFAHAAIGRCKDFRVTKVHLSGDQTCFFGVQVGGQLHFLRLQDTLLTPLRFGCQLTAAQSGPGLGKVGIAAGILASEAPFSRDRLLHVLLCCRMRLIQAFLAIPL